jgi:NodT family efflux transporter outer membrane factor (OMF) lipoprotein
MHKEDEDTKRAIRGGPRAFVQLASLVGALALGGCNVGPNFKAPEVTVNKSWSPKSDPRISTQTAVDALWWKEFKDPGLDRLIEFAQRDNLPLQVSALRIVEARAQYGVVTGKQWPQTQQLFANGQAVGLNQREAALLGINRNFGAYELGFDAVWELDFWGKYRRGVEAETAALLGSVADYYYSLISVTAEVARTYVAMRTFEVLIEQARKNAVVQEQSLQIAESRLRNGATSELDVTQATALLETTLASIPQLQTKLLGVQNALNTLLGQPTGALAELLAGPKQIPKAPAQVAVSVPAEMLRRRPDIRSAEMSAAAQCARIGVAKADLYPSFSIAGSIGLRAATNGPATSNLFSADSVAYSIGPKIVWPFFNYGRLKNNVRVEDARFQQLLVQYRNTVLKAAQEVEDALTGFINAQEALQYEQRSVKASERSVEIALAQYREGATDYQRVLDAQRSLLEHENSLAQTDSSIATSMIALYKALGGGWELRHGQPFLSEQTRKEMEDRTDWSDILVEPKSPEKNQPPPPPTKQNPGPPKQSPAPQNPPPENKQNPAPQNPAPENKQNQPPENKQNPTPGKP